LLTKVKAISIMMKSDFQLGEINCPACHSTDGKKNINTYTALQAAAHFCPSTRDADRNNRLLKCIERLWKGKESSFLQCTHCGFGFGYPYVGGDEEFYSILHEQKGYPSWKWDFDYAMEQIQPSAQRGKILDIGAGEGLFLIKVKEQFEPFALEGSETTRKLLRGKGVTVFADISETIAKLPGQFDYITIFQVLEHLSDFRPLLLECSKLLKPGGKIIITVPDCDAMILQEQTTGCADMMPNHINKWTPKSLGMVLQEAGFKASPAVYHPDSYKNIIGALHLRMIHNATRKGSLASKVYMIKNKKLRIAALASLAVPTAITMFSSFPKLKKGGSFAMTGSL
jgi:SAM-dependent methyltransferase